MWGAVVGLVVGALVLVAFVALQGDDGTMPVERESTPPNPTSSPTPEVSVPVGEDAIPGVGGDVFLGGGLAQVPVPAGWTLLARGDRPDDPGGYAESAVLSDPVTGITFGVYLLAETSDPSDALAVADARAREWTRDGREAEFEPAEVVPPFGEVAGAATVRYRYVRDAPLAGEVVAAVREDGITLLIFVEGDRGSFQGETWGPLRDVVLEDFGT